MPAQQVHEPGGLQAAIEEWDELLWSGGNSLPSRTDFWFARYAGLLECRDSAGEVHEIPAVMGLDHLYYPAHRINDSPENVPPELTYGDVTEQSTGRSRPVELSELSQTMNAPALRWMLSCNVNFPGRVSSLRLMRNPATAQIAVFDRARGLSFGLHQDPLVYAVRGHGGLLHPVEDVARVWSPQSQLMVYGDGVVGMSWDGPAFDRVTYEAAVNAQRANKLPIYQVLASRSRGWRRKHLWAVELPDGSLIPVVLCRDKVWRPIHETDPQQLDAPVTRRVAIGFISSVVAAVLLPGDIASTPAVRRDRLSLPSHFGGIVTTPDTAYSRVTSRFAFHYQYWLTHRKLPTGATTARCDMLGLGDFRRSRGWAVWAGVVRTGDRPGEARLILEVPKGSVVLYRFGDAIAFDGQGVPTTEIYVPSVMHRDGAVTAWSADPTDAAAGPPQGGGVPCLFLDGGQQMLPLDQEWIPDYKRIGTMGKAPADLTPIVSLDLTCYATGGGRNAVDIYVNGIPTSGSVIGRVTVVVPPGVNPTQVANGVRPLIGPDGRERPFLDDLLSIWTPQVFGSEPGASGLGNPGQALGDVPTYTTTKWPHGVGVKTDGGTVYFWTGELGPGDQEVVAGGASLS